MGNFCCCDSNTEKEKDIIYIDNMNNKEFTPLSSIYGRDSSVRYIRIDSLDDL